MFKNSHRLCKDPLNWYWFRNGFSAEEIEKIEEYANSLPRLKGNVGESTAEESERKSVVRWFYRNPETEWLYAKLISMANEANEVAWQFDMYSSDEAIQYTEYHDDGGHYDFHLDMSAGHLLNQRKISMTVQLSDATEYDGGNFEIMRGRAPEELPKEKGTVLVFPSYILHRVTPVTRGTRKSLVLWLGGGSFK